MEKTKTINRWMVVVGAVFIQLCLGAIYAWSVFTPPLKEAGWSNQATQIIFSVGLASFAIWMVIAGRLLKRFGPRKLCLSGGWILGIGYILGGFFGQTHFLFILITIGVIGGTGIGLGYVVPIAVGIRWFPDKKGLITGLAVAGFGFGSLLWVKLAGSWANLLTRFGLSQTFVLYGFIFLLLISLGSLWMVFPPEGWKPKGWSPPQTPQGKPLSGSVDFSSQEMLKTWQFYFIFLTMAFGTGAGLMCVGLMKLFPMSAMAAQGMSLEDSKEIAGTAMAVFFSLANGLGRILWGWISDRIGRKLSIVIMTGIQGIVVILFQWMAGTPALLYLGATLIGFNFGGNFALFPTLTADIFGSKNIGLNYGWVFLAYGVGGIVFPILGGRLGDLNNFPLAFTLVGILCILATLLIGSVKPPQKKWV